MTALIVYPLFTTCLYYLGAWAKITAFAHSRYPKWLKGYMNCAACVGTAYGAVVALFGQHVLKWPFITLTAWYTPVIVAGCAMVWTPIIARALIYALSDLRPADEPEAQ